MLISVIEARDCDLITAEEDGDEEGGRSGSRFRLCASVKIKLPISPFVCPKDRMHHTD